MLLYVCYNNYELGTDPDADVNTNGLASPPTNGEAKQG
jgi:hypothetical protein